MKRKKAMPNRLRRCTHCKDYGEAVDGIKTPAGWFHDELCAMQYAKEKYQKTAERARKKAQADRKKDTRQRRDAIKTRSDWLKEAQREFNRFIRLRDRDDRCICCGRDHQGQYHAGHYLSVGSHPELRFNEDNCHKQASYCNNHKSGNQAEYRIKLIEKIGVERVELLEGPHEAAKWTIDDIKEIRIKYKAKCKELN